MLFLFFSEYGEARKSDFLPLPWFLFFFDRAPSCLLRLSHLFFVVPMYTTSDDFLLTLACSFAFYLSVFSIAGAPRMGPSLVSLLPLKCDSLTFCYTYMRAIVSSFIVIVWLSLLYVFLIVHQHQVIQIFRFVTLHPVTTFLLLPKVWSAMADGTSSHLVYAVILDLHLYDLAKVKYGFTFATDSEVCVHHSSNPTPKYPFIDFNVGCL